jgi:carbonic anhydrase/acetyltransferase-like protein (isoleucine patch superfamily)
MAPSLASRPRAPLETWPSMNEAAASPLFVRLLRAAAGDIRPLVSRKLLADLAASLPSSAFDTTRTTLFRAAGVQIGAHSLIQGSMRLTGEGNPCSLLSIGHHTLVTGGLHIDLAAPVRIGHGVRIGHDVSILTVSHAVGSAELRAGTSFFAEIVIEDGCWIASRSTLLPGVVVGRGSVVAAGAVVTRSVPKHTLVAGVPARVVRELSESEEGEPVPDGVWAVRQ